jgi:hypothetical protein
MFSQEGVLGEGYKIPSGTVVNGGDSCFYERLLNPVNVVSATSGSQVANDFLEIIEYGI